MNAGAVATPLLFVVAVAVVTPPVNVPLGPVGGGENVTVKPGSGTPLASLTTTWRAVENAVLTVALCPLPAVAVMLEGEPKFVVARAPPEIGSYIVRQLFSESVITHGCVRYVC